MRFINEEQKRKMVWGFTPLNYFLAAILFVILILVCSGKEGMHIDEYYTFFLSNSLYTETNKVSPEVVNYQVFTGEEIFSDLLATREETKFNILNVIAKQSSDVHPPLYYIIINFACSFTNNSDWLIPIGLAINVALYMLTYFALTKLVNIWINDLNYAGAISFLCCTTYGMLDGVAFIRMYVLLLLFAVLVAYWLISHYPLRNESYVSFYIVLYILTLCGTLTQYYFVLYLVFIALTYGVFLAFHRQFKELLFGILAIGCGGGTAFLLFPAMYYHIFQSYRGVDSIEATVSGMSWDRLSEYVEIINRNLFNGYGILLIGCLLGMIVAKEGIISNKNNESFHKYILLSLPALLSFLFIANSAPYISERYVYSLFFCIYLSVVLIVWKVLFHRKNLLICLLLLTMGVNLFSNINNYPYSNYYQEQTLEQEIINEKVSEESLCICVYNTGARWKIFTNLLCFKDYENVMFIPFNTEEEINIDGYENVVLFLDSALIEEFDMSVLSVEFNICEEVIQKVYWSVYNMYN